MQILEAVDLFLKGTPLRTICNIFEKKGYTYRGKSGRVSQWEPKRLKYVFASKLYLGYMKYKGEWYKGDHVPIYDQETFDKLQALLKQRAEMFEKHKKKCRTYSSYLGGMIYCKQCGARYGYNSWRQRNGTNKFFYTCHSRSKKMKQMIKDPNCKNKNWHMDELDEIVFNEIRKWKIDPEYMRELTTANRDENAESNKVDILKDEIKKLDDQISRFMDLYGIGKFTIDQVSEKVDPLNDRRNALIKELDAIRGESKTLTEEESLMVIEFIEETFDNESGDIGVITETLIREDDTKIKSQSVTFALPLKY